MAYASLISLKQTIERLLNSRYHSNLLSNTDIESVYQGIWWSQAFLEKESYLPALIEESTLKLTDAVATHVSDPFPSEAERVGDEGTTGLTILSQEGLQKVKREMDSFVETVKQIKQQYRSSGVLEPSNSPGKYFAGKKSMVGLHDEEKRLEHRLVGGPFGLEVVSVVGMAGIGKTTLVKQVYDNESVSFYFDLCAFVTVGPECNLKEILLSVLVQVNSDNSQRNSDDRLEENIYLSLRGKRYLIVLDDVWNVDGWDEIRKAFPDDYYGSRIILTTRLAEVALYFSKYSELHWIRLLNEEESWELLSQKVFVEMPCPAELEKVGKKIAKNCEGLPLAIITVANLLSKAEKTVAYWNKIAESEYLVVAGGDDDSPFTKSLFLSYKHLPQHLKPCFLYMGVFPQDYEITLSKLTKLWDAEGFLELKMLNTAEECLEGLVSRSLVLVNQKSSSSRIKTCSTHHVFRHLCVREAEKDGFFHLMNSYASRLPEGIHRQRRLCVHKNVLFGIKDVYKSMESASNACSLLCMGPNHPYPVPVHVGLMLLRVLDALTIRFYEFPTKILELVELRYLALTYNGEIPSSISKLQKLKYLIVHPNLIIICSAIVRFMPEEIWEMQELRHLQCIGYDLPNPPSDTSLPNLLKLSDVSPRSCTKEILRKIPNLKKLGVRIVVVQDGVGSLDFFNHVSLLNELESFKCVVPNPDPMSRVLHLPDSISTFPSSIRKLTLSGCGFDWKDMSLIGALPNLEVLKLRCYAFRGREWEPNEEEFQQLEFLLLEDADLVNWRGNEGCFPWLERLIVRHCYKLEEMPSGLGDIVTLQMIELVDCSASAVDSVKQIEEKQLRRGNLKLQVQVHSSAYARKLRS